MSKSVIIDNLVNDQLYGFRMFPRNLKGQYQTETDGATATATPKAIGPIFGNNTWEVINLASTTNTIPSTWHVGDIKDITLTTGETITMQICGFNHDDLTDGSGKAGITLCIKNSMNNKRRINGSNTSNFVTSELNNWLQNDLVNSLPSDLKNYVKNINKSYKNSTYNTKIFIFSIAETLGNKSGFDIEGIKYALFNDETQLSKGEFWLRTYSNTSSYPSLYLFGAIKQLNQTLSDTNKDIVFGFCI